MLYVCLAAFGGGIVAALLGWMKSGEAFIARKFVPSVLRALVAGGAFALTYAWVGTSTMTGIVIAFVAGAGVDVIGHRLASSVKK